MSRGLGDVYKRQWRKDFIVLAQVPPELCLEDDFADIVMGYFKLAEPLIKELCRAVRVPF
jgi:hypothetical protein